MSLQDTLCNEAWLRTNEKAIKDMLPETWTHVHNLNGLKIGFTLKLLGIDWRSQDEFGKVMVFLERTKFMLRDGLLVRRNPNNIFQAEGK